MALTCPVVPTLNVVCDSGSTVQGSFTGGVHSVDVIVDLRSAPSWCVTATLNATVQNLTSTGEAGEAVIDADIYSVRQAVLGENQVGHTQQQSIYNGDSGSLSVTGLGHYPRGVYTFTGRVYQDSSDDETVNGGSTDLYLSIVAVPTYTQGSF